MSAARRNGLNDRQRAFVAAYLTNGFNTTRAAMATGHNPSRREAGRSEHASVKKRIGIIP